MIPKIIHYCWFGGNPLPELAVRCIESWKKFCPDYEIKEWNEDNYDVRKIPYISEAYDAKKYAFVSDYARFDILYQYGGIYFDTDVEVIKDLSPIIEKGAFAGVESAGAINAGLGLACESGLNIYKEILQSYQEEHFLKSDGSYNLKTVVSRVSEVFCKHGFVKDNVIQEVAGVRVYPTEYFCPKDLKTMQLNITENSYTIHHYDGSWCPAEVKRLLERKKWIAEHVKNKFLASFLKKCCTALKMIGM
ncbi:MAG: glycosyl transferase [Bacteroidales bacterium]|nr:glycosyl transferase [Bacteroidales bacterium]